jgi:hypothetical protein
MENVISFLLLNIVFGGLPLVTWVPFLRRIFSRNGMVGVRRWSLIFGFSSWVVVIPVSDLTFHLPWPMLYPMAFFAFPLPFNVCFWVKRFRHSKDIP